MQPDSSVKKADALIAFGANQGDGREALRKAVDLLKGDSNILEISCSEPHVTKAVTGNPADSDPQGEYVNAAVRVLTTFKSTELFDKTNQIENQLGRERIERWGPRTIDLDLLLYNDHQIDTEALVIPHPRMAFRRFVLEPALQIAAEMVHPVSGMTLRQLVDHLNQSDPRVVVATDEAEFASKLNSPNDWGIQVVEKPDDFIRLAPQASLVVSYFKDSEANANVAALARFASNFAGPVLKLHVKHGQDVAMREVQAAIEAMQVLG